MDHQFDVVAKAIATGQSRRAALRWLGGMVGSVLMGSPWTGYAAAPGKAGNPNQACNNFCSRNSTNAKNRQQCVDACRQCGGDTTRLCGTFGALVCRPSGTFCCGASYCSNDNTCCNGICCASGKVCTNNVCCNSGSTGCGQTCCTSGLACCNGVCCPSGQACINGACGCANGASLCNGVCVDTYSSFGNCGGCATSCTAGQGCENGQCVGGATNEYRCVCQINSSEVVGTIARTACSAQACGVNDSQICFDRCAAEFGAASVVSAGGSCTTNSVYCNA